MSTLNRYFNARVNPYTGEREPKNIIAGDANSDYPYILSPASPNAPENSPTRIEIELPEVPDLTDLTNRSFKLYKNSINPANILTVTPSLPTENDTYRIGLPEVERSHCIQLSPNLINTPIYYDYWGLGTVMNAVNFEKFVAKEVKTRDIIIEKLISETDGIIIENNQIKIANIQTTKIHNENSSFNVTAIDNHKKTFTTISNGGGATSKDELWEIYKPIFLLVEPLNYIADAKWEISLISIENNNIKNFLYKKGEYYTLPNPNGDPIIINTLHQDFIILLPGKYRLSVYNCEMTFSFYTYAYNTLFLDSLEHNNNSVAKQTS